MNDFDIALRSHPSESDFVSYIHVAKIRISKNISFPPAAWILLSVSCCVCGYLFLPFRLTPHVSQQI